jgi:type IV pilus assembly protein PilE
MKRRAAGFSLLELMIAVAILGIITVAAVASYNSSMVKARRGSAEACLMEAAQFMERNFTVNMTYEVDDFPELACAFELEDFYDFDFDGAPDADSYTVQATPIGAQADADTKCGALSLNQAGAKVANDVSACW